MDLHPDCEQLGFLLGVWRGAGEGSYPTIESFGYTEEVTFSHVGKPFLAYTQKTKHAVSGAPLHAEAGYLRAVGAGRVEFVVVQPSGIVELHSGTVDRGTVDRGTVDRGTVDGGALVLQIDGVHTTPTAKSVTDVHRQIWVEQHAGVTTLEYQVSMAAVGEPLTHHLRATLVQQSSG
ncbi:FABP family protein [bacterium]|nr:FABP family protein [bacterium]